jgi:hypothetical protein
MPKRACAKHRQRRGDGAGTPWTAGRGTKRARPRTRGRRERSLAPKREAPARAPARGQEVRLAADRSLTIERGAGGCCSTGAAPSRRQTMRSMAV